MVCVTLERPRLGHSSQNCIALYTQIYLQYLQIAMEVGRCNTEATLINTSVWLSSSGELTADISTAGISAFILFRLGLVSL